MNDSEFFNCLNSGIAVHKDYWRTGLSLLLTYCLNKRSLYDKSSVESNIWLKEGWGRLLTERSGTRMLWSSRGFQKPGGLSLMSADVWVLLQAGCLLMAIPLQMAEVSRLVIKAMVYRCSGVDRYELYNVRTSVSKQILILLLALIYGRDQFSEY